MMISIAMTTFNGDSFLEEQLGSISKQTQLPHELVISDDCSTDNTIKIIEDFISCAPYKVRLIKNEKNNGFTKNFEIALNSCKGDIIFLADQDDFWYENKVSDIVKIFNEKQDISLIIHNADLADSSLQQTTFDYLEQVKRGFGSDYVFNTGALTALRSELLRYALPFPPNLNGHDGYLHLISHLLQKRLVIRNKLQLIRRHSANTSDWLPSSLKKINKLDVFLSQLKTKISQNYDDRKAINAFATDAVTRAISDSNELYKNALKESLFFLKNEKEAIYMRNNIASSSFFKKKILAIKMLMLNYYKHFNGIKSFLRDMIR